MIECSECRYWQIALRRVEMPVSVVSFYSLSVAQHCRILFSFLLIFLTGGLAEGALFSGAAGILLLIIPFAHSGRWCSSSIPIARCSTVCNLD